MTITQLHEKLILIFAFFLFFVCTGSLFTYIVRSGCHNLVGIQNDVVSSVNPKESCFILYEHSNCRGLSTRVLPDSESKMDLGKVGLNDAVSSFQLCQ